MSREPNGDSLGAVVYLSPEDLAEFGVPEDASSVTYDVIDGELRVSADDGADGMSLRDAADSSGVATG